MHNQANSFHRCCKLPGCAQSNAAMSFGPPRWLFQRTIAEKNYSYAQTWLCCHAHQAWAQGQGESLQTASQVAVYPGNCLLRMTMATMLAVAVVVSSIPY